MQNMIEAEPVERGEKALLMAEFSVQVYSNGEVEWDGLERYVRPPAVDVRRLLAKLEAAAKRK